MQIQTLLCGPVVRRCDDEQPVDRQLGQPADALDRRRGAARARADNHRNAPPHPLTGALRQLAQFRIEQRGGLARRAAHDDAARAVREMQIDKACPSVEVDGTVRAHGRRDGDQTA